MFAGGAVAGLFAPPFYPRLILRQIVYIGYFSLPVVGLTALFTGMVLALQILYRVQPLQRRERDRHRRRARRITRELGPVIAGLMVAGRVGAAMAAEIGTMRVTEQIDALTTLSTDPLRYLVLPRLLAGLITMPCLVLVADIIGVFGGYLVGVYKLELQPGHLPDADPALSRNDGCRLRSDQGRRVRLYRRADGVLSRLLFARRRRGCRAGDDAGRRLGLDPDPAVQLRC